MFSISTLRSASLVFGFALAGCAGAPSQESAADAPASADPSEAELSTKTSCEQTQVFAKYGLATDLRNAVDPRFVANGYEVTVPGSIRAFDSYGGDMVYTVLGASASAERVFAQNPGGAFSAEVGGTPGSSARLERQSYQAGKALFDALTRAVESTHNDGAQTVTSRRSAEGRISCERRRVSGGPASYSCTFSDLLFVRPGTLVGNVDFCPGR